MRKTASAVAWQVGTFRVALRADERMMFNAAAARCGQHVGPWLRCMALKAIGARIRPGPRRAAPLAATNLLLQVHATPAERKAFLSAAEAAKQPVSTWLRNCGRLSMGLPLRLGLRGVRASRVRDTGVCTGRRPTARTLRAAAALGIEAPCKPPPHCPQGHKFTRANTDRSQGTRKCRECHRQSDILRSERATT